MRHERVGVRVKNVELIQIAGRIIKIVSVGDIDKPGKLQPLGLPNAGQVDLMFLRVEKFEYAM